MRIDAIIQNPLIAMKEFVSEEGNVITLQPLLASNTEKFGNFLEGLSAETNKRFQPHPLTKQAAQEVCANLDYRKILRLISSNDKNEITAYFLLQFSFPDYEKERYASYGIALSETRDCRIAPVVADAYQNKGLGSIMMDYSLNLAKELQIRYVVLWSGAQATNQRAIHFYEKFGFKKMGEFEKNDMNNYDMMLVL